MDILARVSAYANPPFNYLGTTLFLSYIALAIFFTSSTLISLYRQYKRIPSAKVPQDIKDARRRHIKIYAFVASVSFAMLSYSMLNFLIQSLTKWARAKNLLGTRVGLFDLDDWMLQTNLFESFAQELVGRRPSAVWTQVALLGTWFWNVWMAYKAQQHKLSTRKMLPFIVLSQILPITFTASLFTIQLHLDAMGLAASSPPKKNSPLKKDIPPKKSHKANSSAKADEKPKTDENTKTQQPSNKKSSVTLPTIVLNAVVLALPTLKTHMIFIPLILFTRLMLLVPHTGRLGFSQKDVLQSISISFGFVVANLTMMKGTTTYQEVLAGVHHGGFAVKALGYDAELALALCTLLKWGGGV